MRALRNYSKEKGTKNMNVAASQLTILGIFTMPSYAPASPSGAVQYNAAGVFGAVNGSVAGYAGYDLLLPRPLFDEVSVAQVLLLDTAIVGGSYAVRMRDITAGNATMPLLCRPLSADQGAETTPGSIIGWQAVYAANGTLTGKVPVYDNFT